MNPIRYELGSEHRNMSDADAEQPELDRLCVDTIRVLSMDAVQCARSGGAAAHALETREHGRQDGTPASAPAGSG